MGSNKDSCLLLFVLMYQNNNNTNTNNIKENKRWEKPKSATNPQ